MNFALIGASGFVAPRHMAAIKECGGTLVAALDPHDSVGVLDKYFPECHFFTEFERFDRHCSRRGDIDYVTVCSPNYLHDAHARFALRIGADVICEKPTVIHPRNLDQLQKLEIQTGGKVWTILQLRLTEAVKNLKEEYTEYSGLQTVGIEYTTPRGLWYQHSWKGNEEKSGGLIYNIGVHLVDITTHVFGELMAVNWVQKSPTMVSGRYRLENAMVNFALKIDGPEPKRIMTVGDVFPRGKSKRINLSSEFGVLHNASYMHITAGNGFGLDQVREAIKICYRIKAQ